MESWPRPPEQRLAFLASVGLHLLFVLYWMSTLVGPRAPKHALIEPPVVDTSFVPIDMPYSRELVAPIPPVAPRGPALEGAARPTRAEALAPAQPSRVASASRPRPSSRVQESRSESGNRPVPSGAGRERPSSPSDTASAPDEFVEGRIAPQYARGRLWVRPLPLPAQELAQRLTGSRKALADSVVNRAVQAYLDSIAADPNAPKGMPSWTTKLAGKTFGVDGKYLYFAGLKIPAAVLALLPIQNAGVSFDRDRAWRHMMDLRADLQQAAMRSENQEEFKKAIKEIRERKEREAEAQRNQGTAPQPGSPAASPPPPPPPAAAKPDLTPTP